MTGHQDDSFFVGYSKTPRQLAIFYALLVPIVIGAMIGVGVGFAASQGDPGNGRFMGGRQTITGIVVNTPYPVLYILPTKEEPKPGAVMLAGPGKTGALPRTGKFDGTLVDITGVYIARGDIRIFQVGRVRASEIDLSSAARDSVLPKPVSLAQHALSGEIVDSKCYLGAMRPGQGKIHMACANLCIHGGIPPVFVTYEGSDLGGEATYFLLADPEGNPIDATLFNFTSLAVTLKGEVEKRGDLHILKVTPADIEVL